MVYCVGKRAIEDEILAELDKLIELVKRMIAGEAMSATPLMEFREGGDDADLVSIFDEEREFIFIDSRGNGPLEDYIELRSTTLPEMAITLPRPMITALRETRRSKIEGDKWREDLC